MKKILWLLILFPIFMTKVWASDIYYSDYGEFSDYQQESVEMSDVIDVETKFMYKWYKNIKIAGDYKLYNLNDNFLDDCYYTDYSIWSNDKPIKTESNLIEEKTIYNYKMIKPVRYIHLYDVVGSYDAFRITELQVFIDDIEIEYSYECEGCWTNFDEYIHNGVYFENKSYIDNNGYLVIDLGKDYPINKVKVVFYLFDMGSSTKEYTLGYSTDSNNIFISKSFEHNFSSEYLKDTQKFEYVVNDIADYDDLWLTNETKEKFIDNDFVYSKTSYQQYRYKNKMCRTYTLEKEYYPEYSEVSIGDYINKSDETLFYRYRVRDKLELGIHDISQKNYDLNNFVITSTGDYEIEHNINWDKNDTYNVKFALNNLVVDKQVNLLILENSLQEKDDEIENLKQQLQNTISDYERIIETLEKNNNEYLTSLNNLNDEINQINQKILELETIDNITELDITDLKKQLQNHIDEYNKKISELEQIDKVYLENLTILNDTINYLEEKLQILKDNSEQQIIELRIKIDEIIKKYESKIDDILTFNQGIENKLDDLYCKINEFSNNLIEKQIKDEIVFDDLYSRLEESFKIIGNIKNNTKEIFKKIENVDNRLSDLELKLHTFKNDIKVEKEEINEQIENVKEDSQNKYDEVLKEQNKLNNEIKEYENNIDELNKLNLDYINQIGLLKKQIEELKERVIGLEANIDKKYNNIINNQESIFDEFTNVKSEMIDTYTNEIELVKSDLEQVTQSLQEKEENDINSKLNNYVLRINGVEKFSLLGVYILLLIIFIGYVIYLFKKKSNKNNS